MKLAYRHWNRLYAFYTVAFKARQIILLRCLSAINAPRKMEVVTICSYSWEHFQMDLSGTSKTTVEQKAHLFASF